jgi:hypothetical protein
MDAPRGAQCRRRVSMTFRALRRVQPASTGAVTMIRALGRNDRRASGRDDEDAT